MIGIDEVGRGCWAGPLVAAAVQLPEGHNISGLTDSKKLSANARTLLAEQIKSVANFGIGWVSAAKVDSLGLTEAVRLAMQRAIGQLDHHDNEIIIDGNYNYLDNIPNTSAVIKADGSIDAVSAASIIAKVARDLYMRQLDSAYDIWEFHTHVGYGTARHVALLRAHGVSDIHRKSYKPIKALL